MRFDKCLSLSLSNNVKYFLFGLPLHFLLYYIHTQKGKVYPNNIYNLKLYPILPSRISHVLPYHTLFFFIRTASYNLLPTALQLTPLAAAYSISGLNHTPRRSRVAARQQLPTRKTQRKFFPPPFNISQRRTGIVVVSEEGRKGRNGGGRWVGRFEGE